MVRKLIKKESQEEVRIKVLKVSCPECKKKFLGEMDEIFFQLSFHLVKEHAISALKAEEISKARLAKGLPKSIGVIKLVK